MIEFFDTHAHLDYPDFETDLPQIVRRAEEAGITCIISFGTNLESSRRAIGLTERFGPVFAVVGWHPSDALDAPADIREEFRQLSRHTKDVALGGTGLDHNRLPSERGGTSAEDARSFFPKLM